MNQNKEEKEPHLDYDNPPLVEMILGVQFERLSDFQNAHLGAFWKTLPADEWPVVSDAPPLNFQFEEFLEGGEWAKAVQHLRLTQDPASRVQIRNQDGSRMIQVQNGRLHFNCLKGTGNQYLHYNNVREVFLLALERFITFISQENLGKLRFNQWEITYLNHIPRDTVWNTPQDWGFWRLLGPVRTVPDVIQGESFSGEWHFVVPEQRGRLHIKWQHAVKSDSENQEIVVLTLTARGPLIQDGHQNVQHLLEGLDLGHETIVTSFKQFMDDKANNYWGLRNASN